MVIAHVERCVSLRLLPRLRRLQMEFGALMQMNAYTVAAHQGWLRECWIHKAIEGGCIDLIASDAHNINGRQCLLKRCRDTLAQRYGEAAADRLCGGRQAELLGMESQRMEQY